MARIYGLNGLIRGRQGNNVFSVQNGTQVVKLYNPVVSNPRTLAQREQRTKFALAGKMSMATPNEALVGLSGASKRNRRAQFVRSLVAAASTSGTINELTASVPYTSVVYSEGSVPQWSAVPTISASFAGTALSSRVTVTVQSLQLSTGAPAGYGELLIVALYDIATSRLEEVQVQERVTGSTSTFIFRQGTRRNVYIVTYIAPFIEDVTRSRLRTSNLQGDENNVTLSANSIMRLSSASWGQSIPVAVTPVLGAETAVAPSPGDDDNR